jgi:3-oxoadipate enol-lactonase
MPFARVDGEHVFYEREGSGPPLLLVHSLGTGSWLWREQVRHWKDRYTVIAADCRGHGRSSGNGGCTMEGCARDLGALMEALDLPPALVVGLSMGGIIAAHLYSLTARRLRGLVLADTFCHMPGGEQRIADIGQRLVATTMEAFGQGYAAETLLPRSQPTWGATLAAGIAATRKDAYLDTVKSLFVQDTRPLLARVEVPVLVLVGEHDRRTPRALADEIVQAAPGAILQVIPGAAHLANLDNPQAFHAAVDGFLATLP